MIHLPRTYTPISSCFALWIIFTLAKSPPSRFPTHPSPPWRPVSEPLQNDNAGSSGSAQHVRALVRVVLCLNKCAKCDGKMLIKNQKMDEVNPENINIIKKIIDDFEQNARGQKQRRRGRSCKISQSDSLIHRYRRCQISPKSGGSLDGAFFRIRCRGDSLDDFIRSEDEVYINFVENGDDNGNADANAFKPRVRKSFLKANSVGVDEVKLYMESKKHQERVTKNVKEVNLCVVGRL
ncbi:hypothetical protein Zmor_017153 [Zophobas morio]|uniref:Uncharacterized protein n=1 Tax=Zophobas morio TaxID=2755281 RepID=A0AA38I8H3_9CUCU|nr:hypothetical protein Zmor_017153 [Zophobas morio]